MGITSVLGLLGLNVNLMFVGSEFWASHEMESVDSITLFLCLVGVSYSRCLLMCCVDCVSGGCVLVSLC